MKIVLLQSNGIIDSATWLKCQRKLEKNKQIGNSFSNNTSWLSGKLICAKCGHKMTTVKGETRKYFLCTGKTHKKTCTGIKQTLYVEDVEEMVDNFISQKLDSLKLSKVHHSNENEAQINIIKLKIKEGEQKLSSLSDAIISGSLNEEMIAVLNERAKKLTEEKRKYLNEINDLLMPASGVHESLNFSKKWDKADFKERRAICNILIKTIVVSEDGNFNVVWNI